MVSNFCDDTTAVAYLVKTLSFLFNQETTNPEMGRTLGSYPMFLVPSREEEYKADTLSRLQQIQESEGSLNQ